MTSVPSTKLVAARLEPKFHDRAAFSCGEPSLDEYLKKRAGQDSRNNVTVTYVLAPEAEPTRVAGYFTLSSYAVLRGELPEGILKKLPNYDRFPSLLIGRLARDEAYRGAGLGEILLVEALQRSVEASERVGLHSVVVEALNGHAAEFYGRFGFVSFRDEEHRLFLPMGTVRQLFS